MKRRPIILILLSILVIAPLFSLVMTEIRVLHSLENTNQEVSAEATLEMAYSEAIGSDNDTYHFQPNGAGYTTRNPDHNLTVDVTADSLTIAINDGTWQLTSHQAADSFTVDDNRLTIHREGYDEWYVNGPVGLQQGFTLYEPSEIVIDVGGTIPTKASAQSLSIGADLNFVGLMAYDADGETVPVEFELEGDKLAYAYDDVGAVYPLTIDPWLQQAKLIAADGAAGDWFGYSVALEGDTALVGKPSEFSGHSGNVYVFIRSGTTWSQQQKLTPGDGAGGDIFGWSVALDGDTALVGSPGDKDNGAESGSAYVFTRSGSTWTQQAKLLASDGTEGDIFGYSVALSGDTALVGSPGDDDNGAESGSAYVFARSDSTWTQQQKLIPGDGTFDEDFGVSVSLDGDTALVGTPHSVPIGSAYVFTRSGTTWSQQQKLIPGDGAVFDLFGSSVSLDGNTALIGAHTDSDNSTYSGSVYVFVRSGTTWSQQQELYANDAAANDQFGYSVSLDGDTALVGAYHDNDNGTESGSAYVFTRSGTTWSQQQKLTASDGAAYDEFGISVALSGDTALVGAYQDYANNSGSAYVFFNDPFGPTPTPSNTPTNTPTFTPSLTPSETPTNTPTATDTSTSTPSNTPTDTPTSTDTLTPTETTTPSDTPIPPTDTLVPPSDTPGPITLAASAACGDENLAVTISAGDGPFNITASAGINTPVNGVGIGTTTINGPEKWDNLTVTETNGDMQSINLGQFKCRTDERPVPLTPAHRERTTNPFPTFSWTAISGANNYRVFVFDDKVAANRTVDIRQNSGGPTMLVLSAPLPDGRLFWRVRGRQNRVWSLWSVRFTLFKDPVAPLTNPTPVPTIDLSDDLSDAPTIAPTFPAPPNSR